MDKLFNVLSDDDKLKIEDYIRAYASNDGDELYPDKDLDYLLRVWDRNKMGLYNLFGQNLILKKEIEYLQPIEEICDKIDVICRNTIFIDLYRDKLKSLFDINNGVWNGDEWTRYYKFLSLSNSETLSVNKYTGDTITVMVNDRKITCQDGTKPLKILGKLSKALGIEKEFEEFRIAVSVATNQRKLKGTLCLSIHPLDFMTMSDNDCDWSSCMSWKDCGCYRQGTVEMMNSSNVIVAYLAAEDEMELMCDHKWNNKKWRCLFIVDDNGAVSVKAYPYHNSELSMSVLNWIKELTGNKYANIDTIPYRQQFSYNGNSIFFGTTTGIMYNDFGRNTVHYGMLANDLTERAYFNDKGNYYRVIINYSGPSECLKCGSTDASFNSEGDLVCIDCDDRVICAECGEFLNEYDAYELDGSYYCESCYNDYYTEDAITGEGHHEKNMEIVYLNSSEAPVSGFKYDIPYIVLYAGTFARYSLLSNYCVVDGEDLIHEDNNNRATSKYVNVEDLNDNGASLFGYDSVEDLKDYYFNHVV